MPFSGNFDPETCTNHIYTILKSSGMIVSTSNLVVICSEKNLMVWYGPNYRGFVNSKSKINIKIRQVIGLPMHPIAF